MKFPKKETPSGKSRSVVAWDLGEEAWEQGANAQGYLYRATEIFYNGFVAMFAQPCFTPNR